MRTAIYRHTDDELDAIRALIVEHPGVTATDITRVLYPDARPFPSTPYQSRESARVRDALRGMTDLGLIDRRPRRTSGAPHGYYWVGGEPRAVAP